jgi:hypothetical protein
MAKRLIAFVGTVLAIVTVIVAIAAAALPNYFKVETKVDGMFPTVYKYSYGAFKECLTTYVGPVEIDSKCSNRGDNCAPILGPSALNPDFMIRGYNGSCTYFNVARAFLILGIFSGLGAAAFSVFYMLKFSKTRSAYLFYFLSVGLFVLNFAIFLISFATLQVFKGKVDSSLPNTDNYPTNVSSISISYDTCYFLSILNFVLAFIAIGVYGFFARPTEAGESKPYTYADA